MTNEPELLPCPFKFGDLVSNGWASDDNPTKTGFFVKTIRGHVELTDGKGKMWQTPWRHGHKLTLASTPTPAATPAAPETRMAPVHGYSAGIPWEMHMRAYDAYSKKHGAQPALIEGGCRGGFHVNELAMFIPGWRSELTFRAKTDARIANLGKQVSKLTVLLDKQLGTPCEQIRHQQEIEAANARIANLEAKIRDLSWLRESDFRAELATARNDALEEVETKVAELKIANANGDWEWAQNLGIKNSLECIRALKTPEGE